MSKSMFSYRIDYALIKNEQKKIFKSNNLINLYFEASVVIKHKQKNNFVPRNALFLL